ncbi:hypothetical protein BVG19_g5688 [[Candida] boidinii]|nr:hypothetical protein BVG19_g5688 [[Candida] boidinii]OWB52000.1 hypothetical protein B5S27_g3571 [[Candida] boidinii]OWB65955.1 hypothetical protein B5S30_g1289 [[Candida] boidinii]
MSGLPFQQADHAPQQDAQQDMEIADQNVKFFNYHEYSLDPDQTQQQKQQQSINNNNNDGSDEYKLIITHFPNVYNDKDDNFRIVRIPRTNLYDYPNFSNIQPGFEDAAIKDPIDPENKIFKPVGTVNNQWFGISSISPLSLYLSQDEFESIMNEINLKLYNAFNAFNWKMITFNILDLISLGIIRTVLGLRFDENYLIDLENYADNLNKSFEIRNIPIKLISPRRSGYLSLDFLIPKPISPYQDITNIEPVTESVIEPVTEPVENFVQTNHLINSSPIPAM